MTSSLKFATAVKQLSIPAMTHPLTMHNAVHVSVGHVLGVDVDNVGVEALKCEVKDEPNESEDIDGDALEECSVSTNIHCADSEEDYLITVKEEQIGHWTCDSTPKEPTQVVQRSEDFTSSYLNEHDFDHDMFKKFREVATADITDDNKEIPTSVIQSESVQYTCDTCQQCYSFKYELERHGRLCSGVWKKDLSCENSTSVKTHIVQKSYSCNVCKKQISQKSGLITHMRIHSAETPYQCNICMKQFSKKRYLTAHIRTHTDDKSYQCNICMKLFSKMSGLTKHIRTHSGEKSYHCNECNKQFSQKTVLIPHMRIHTGEKPYHCNVCKKQFSLKSGFITHMRIHTGEKPYHCNVCKKQYSHKSNLTTHLRTHTGEKPHQCNICKKLFSQKRYLTKHMRRH